MNRREFITGSALALAAAPVAAAGKKPDAQPGEIAYARTLPVKVETDVFVAGGGPAGVAAAVAAREAGARVFIAAGFT